MFKIEKAVAQFIFQSGILFNKPSEIGLVRFTFKYAKVKMQKFLQNDNLYNNKKL